VVLVNTAVGLQSIDGFGGTTLPLVYNGVDYLGLNRDAAIEAAFGQVGIRRGMLSVGVVESPAGAASPFDQRANDNADPFTSDAAGFNFTGITNIWSRVIDPAAAHGYTALELGPLLRAVGALDWLAPIRAADYDRYLDEAAEHVLAVVQHFTNTYGRTPSLLHLFNEPTSGNRELASSSTQEVVDLVKRVGARLQANGFSGVKFVVPNEETMGRSLTVAQAILADPAARPFVGAIGFHQYPYGSAYASPRRILESSGIGIPDPAARGQLEALKALGAQYDVPLWMTEVTEGPGNADYNFGAIENVLARTIHVHDVFRFGGASTFAGMLTFWDSRSHAEHFAGRNIPFLTEKSGIVLVNLQTGQVLITGMGYAVGHYARWLGPDATLLESSSSVPAVTVSAFADPSRNRVVVVATNAGVVEQLVRIHVGGATATGPFSAEVSAGLIRWGQLQGVTMATDGAVELVVPPGGVVSIAIPAN
jgi:O-glycosyl hydrolase